MDLQPRWTNRQVSEQSAFDKIFGITIEFTLHAFGFTVRTRHIHHGSLYPFGRNWCEWYIYYIAESNCHTKYHTTLPICDSWLLFGWLSFSAAAYLCRHVTMTSKSPTSRKTFLNTTLCLSTLSKHLIARMLQSTEPPALISRLILISSLQGTKLRLNTIKSRSSRILFCISGVLLVILSMNCESVCCGSRMK